MHVTDMVRPRDAHASKKCRKCPSVFTPKVCMESIHQVFGPKWQKKGKNACEAGKYPPYGKFPHIYFQLQ